MKRMKRLLSFILAFTLLVTLLPDSKGKTVQAAGDGETAVTQSVTEITLTGNNQTQQIGRETAEKYAVLTGTMKAPGKFTNIATGWPNIGIKVTKADTWSWLDAFQLLYNNNGGHSVKLPNSTNHGTFEDISIAELVSVSDMGADYLSSIFSDSGLKFKVIRLENWAYFLIYTGTSYQIVHRMYIGTQDSATVFTLRTEGFSDSDSVTLTDIAVTSGKEAAVDALSGSGFELKQAIEKDSTGNIVPDYDNTSVDDSMYFPVDSTVWTLEARVSFPEYANYDYSERGYRAAYATPDRFSHGMALYHVKGAAANTWRIQELDGLWRSWNIDPTHSSLLDPEQGGMWIRWMREDNQLTVYTSKDKITWNFAGSRDDLSNDEKGMYIDTQLEAKFTDVSISLDTGITLLDGEYVSLGRFTGETYAVMSGTLKLTGNLPSEINLWPNVNIQVVTDNTDPFKNGFQIIYDTTHNFKAAKIVGSAHFGSFDGVTIAQEQWKNKNDGLLDKLVTEAGLNVKVVRLDSWAYLLADTGAGYEIIARMAGLTDSTTEFAFHCGDLSDDNRALLINYSVESGKEAAVEALTGSRLTVEATGSVSSAADSIYFPLDSTEWTLQARVSIPDYSAEALDTTNGYRSVFVGPGPGCTDPENANTAYAWMYGMGICQSKSGAWQLQNLAVWEGSKGLNTDHAAMMDPAKGGMWIRWVRSGSKLSVYTSADGETWTYVTGRTDLGAMDASATGLHIDTEHATTLTDISFTLEKGILRGSTVSLGDDIGVNFYMELSAKTIADTGAYVQFTLPGANHTEETVKVEDAEQATYNGTEYYVFSCGVAAKDMASDIRLKIVSSDGTEGTEYTYRVMDYGNTILNDTAGTYTDDEKAMVKAMLNYGAYAQTYFSYNTGMLANAGMDEDDKDVSAVTAETIDAATYNWTQSGSVTGLTWYGTSLMTTSRTKIRHYFEVADGASIGDYTFTYGNTTLAATAKGSYYYVEIPNITASSLNGMYTLTVTKGTGTAAETMTLKYGPYTNVKAILAGEAYSDESKNMMRALYLYGEAAYKLKKN